MARPEKVAVVEEIRTKLRGSRRGRPHRIPRAHRSRARRAAGVAARGRHRVQGVQEHAGAPSGRRDSASTVSRRCSRAPSQSPSCGATRPARPRHCATSGATTRRSCSRVASSAPRIITPVEIEALAELPSRDVLLAQVAGVFQAPLTKAAGLFQAFTRNFAYGVKALIDQRGGVPEEAVPEAEAAEAEAPAAEATETESETHPSPKRQTPRRRAPTRPNPNPNRLSPSNRRTSDMATMTTEELLDVFKNMTVLELNELPQGVRGRVRRHRRCTRGRCRGRRCGRRRGRRARGEGRVRRHPRRGGRQEDPGHQGGAVHRVGARSQRGQGPRRQRAEAGAREGQPRKTPRRPRPSSKRPAPSSKSSSRERVRTRVAACSDAGSPRAACGTTPGCSRQRASSREPRRSSFVGPGPPGRVSHDARNHLEQGRHPARSTLKWCLRGVCRCF